MEYDFDSKHLGSTGVISEFETSLIHVQSKFQNSRDYIIHRNPILKNGRWGDNKILKLEEEETKFQGSEWTIYLRINFSLLLSKILSNKSQSIIAEIDEFLE